MKNGTNPPPFGSFNARMTWPGFSSRVASEGVPGFPQLNANQWTEVLANASMARAQLFRDLLDPRRDIDAECGYPSSESGSGLGSIDPDMMKSLYEREAIANRVVQVFCRESWQVSPLVYETEDTETVTDFELAWDNLARMLRGSQSWYQDEKGSPVWEHLRRADILSGIGTFGIILLGFDDGKNLDQPVDGVAETQDDLMGPAFGTPGMSGPLSPAQLFPGASVQFNQSTINRVHAPRYPTQPVGVDDAENEWIATNQASMQAERERRAALVANAPNMLSGYQQPTPAYGGATDPPGYRLGTDAQYMGVQLSPPEYPAQQPSTTPRQLLFMRAFDEPLVQIVQYEADIRNPRFGQPVMYRVTLNDPREQHSGIGLPMATIRVHWSRIIHLADNRGSSDVFGVPRARPVLNRLLDLRKLYGSSAEGFWRAGFPGYVLSTHPELGADVDIDEAKVKDDMENYANSLQRYIILQGMSMQGLSPQIADPTSQVAIQIEAICIQLGIPVRIFKGSERGELASSQDDEAWNDRLRERQDTYLTPHVIVPFIDRLIQAGVLPVPTGYSIEWPDLDSLSHQDKATVANTRTTALSSYVSGQVESVVAPMDFLTRIMGFDEEEAASMLQNAQDNQQQQQPMTMPGQGQPGHPATSPPPPMMVDADGTPITPTPGAGGQPQTAPPPGGAGARFAQAQTQGAAKGTRPGPPSPFAKVQGAPPNPFRGK